MYPYVPEDREPSPVFPDIAEGKMAADKNHTVTIVMAVYNGERYLKEQLQSILEQTSLPDEMILVDDASADGSCKVIEEVMERAPFPWRLIRHEENRQVTRTFEEGYEAAGGDWVMFCDQDDVWEKEKISCFREQAALHQEAAIIFSDCMLTDGDLAVMFPSMYRHFGFPGITGEEVRVIGSYEGCGIFMKQGWVPGMCLMVRKAALIHALPFSDITFFDQWLIWNGVLSGDAVFIDRPLVRYRQHGGNVVGVKDGKRRSLRGLKNYFEGKRQEDKQHMVDKLETMYGLAMSYRNRDACRLIRKAAAFARWRLDFSGTRGIPLTRYLARARRGDYEKYVSSVRDNKTKDLMEVLMFPGAGRRWQKNHKK